MRALPTPSSLKWLITRRARLDGEIAKMQATEALRITDADVQLAALKRQLEDAILFEEARQNIHARTLDALKEDLAATDLLLRQHEFAIDPAIIKPIRNQDNLSLTDYGYLSRLIYRYLREAEGAPRTATQTAAYIALQLGFCCRRPKTDHLGSILDRRQHMHLFWHSHEWAKNRVSYYGPKLAQLSRANGWGNGWERDYSR
jgi:hypothetical protein